MTKKRKMYFALALLFLLIYTAVVTIRNKTGNDIWLLAYPITLVPSWYYAFMAGRIK